MTGAGELVLPRFSESAAELWRWVEAPQDAAVSEFVTTYAGLDVPDCERARSTLTVDDFFTLVLFSQRCALAAVRDHDPSAARRAFDALSAIDLERLRDPRDVYGAAALAGYAAGRVGLDPAEVAAAAAARAESAVRDALIEVTEEPVELVDDWGYREVDTSAGPAFFGDEGEPFDPVVDLVTLALGVAGVLEDGGHYRVTDVTVASDLPAVWLGGDASLTEGLSACVSVHARPGSGALSQFLLVFLAEAVTGEAAAAIALAARTDVPPSVARLGLAAGRVCAVVVAASASQGVPSSEDARSLSRFEPGISELLNLSAGP